MESQTMAPVTVYWRPGCPFCSRLRRDLRAMGVPVREINIWADPAAAARVRSLADGNETVPTVVIGDRAMVNPSAPEVMDQVCHAVPGFTPDAALARTGRRARLLRAIQSAAAVVLAVAGIALTTAGHSGLGWLAAGAAFAVWLFPLAVRRAVSGGGRAGGAR